MRACGPMIPLACHHSLAHQSRKPSRRCMTRWAQSVIRARIADDSSCISFRNDGATPILIRVTRIRSFGMAPRANWKGYLRLSLVTCPIALFPATSEAEKISFNQINRKTGHRIKYVKVDADTGEDGEQ